MAVAEGGRSEGVRTEGGAPLPGHPPCNEAFLPPFAIE